MSGFVLEPFDLTKALMRNADFLVDFVHLSVGGGAPTTEQVEKHRGLLLGVVQDHGGALEEIKRLYGVLEGFRSRHMPHAGEPGAPAMCTTCSLSGTQVPWPCEIFNAASAALPERRP